MARDPDPLKLFHPVISQWFAERVGEPTEIQGLAWPAIAAGEHVLVTAPTGSGKTLAAFLWAIDRLFTETWPTGAVRVLYVSPLRALGNDVRRNLLDPLDQLRSRQLAAGAAPPAIRVVTRTGDTPQSERRAMATSPPEILITTPESLNIMLTSAGGRRLLRHLRTVILDEVHAVVDSKRGTHLMTAVERLVAHSGEFQRIALSATVSPAEVVAGWVAGAAPAAAGGRRAPRPIRVLSAGSPGTLELTVDLPVAEGGLSREPDTLWSELTSRLKRTVWSNRSTLVFANSKRLVEKVARLLNEDEPRQLAYSHHGALSRELRTVVEERLKAGSLRAIVATSSLELGIDVGSIDEVVLIQSPGSVTSTLQRIGRSGHGVGETSRGILYPLHTHALIESAALARAVLDGEIEPARPVANALDVLAQVLVSMTVERRWQLDELFDAVRACDAYAQLPRDHFDRVVEMLSGRYASTRVRGLRPMVSVDRVDGTVQARPGADRLVYLGGGTIPDRGYFNLRADGGGAMLGQLDEEFVWERSVGDAFTLGVQTWRVQRITHNDVFVTPADSRSAMAPFWRAEERDRSSFLSERVARFLEHALARLEDEDFGLELGERYLLAPAAATELRRLLADQVAATGTLPHRRQVVVEHTTGPEGRSGTRQTVLHTLWGGRVNRPFSYALAAAWESHCGVRPDIVHGDDCIVISHRAGDAPEDPFALFPASRIEELLRESLEHSGFFGARFREAAGRALLLPRSSGRRRTPLWLSRQRAKEMLDVVSEHGDFPLVLEAWRQSLHDDFELDALREHLLEITDGETAVRHVTTERPSPFTAVMAWQQTNRLMYEDDRPAGRPQRRLRDDLVRQLVFASHLRPRIPRSLVVELQSKLHRTAAGYSPQSGEELLEWAKERLLIPSDEWSDLIDSMARDHGVDGASEIASVAHRLAAWRPPGGDRELVGAVEAIPAIACALGHTVPSLELESAVLDQQPAVAARAALASMMADRGWTEPDLTLADLLRDWLAHYGPVTPEWIADTLGLDPSAIADALGELAGDAVLVDEITEGCDVVEVCDRDNLERLLRMARAAARPSFGTRSRDLLPLWLASHHRLATRNATLDDLRSALECLVGWPMPVELVETEILPARIEPYHPSWLDSLLVETELEWFGCGPRRIAFALAGDRDLLADRELEEAGEADSDDDLKAVFPGELGRYPVTDLLRRSQRSAEELLAWLLDAAWSGRLSTDSFAPLRQGVATGFSADALRLERAPTGRRSRFDRWRSRLPMAGNWYRLTAPAGFEDALDREEADRDRARLLLDRHGLLFRELVEREMPALRWSAVFRALRMLELAGEVVAGRFFDGVPGLQFMARSAFRRLEDGLPEDLVWWVNAADPASPCGLGAVDVGTPLPRRVPSNHLVFHGRRLVVVSERRCARMTIQVAPEHPRLGAYLEFLRVQLTREASPRASVTVEEINGQPAAASPYRAALGELFHVTRSPTALKVARRY